MIYNDFRSKVTPSLADILSLGGRIVSGSWPFPEVADAREIKVHVMGTATTDMLLRCVAVACAQEGLRPKVSQSLYGAFMQDVLNPASELYSIKPDIVLIVSDWHSLVADIPPSASNDEVALIVDAKVSEILSIWKRLTETLGVKIVHQFPPPPPYRLTGLAEKFLPVSYSNQLRSLFEKLWNAETYGVQMLDLEQFALENGSKSTFAPRVWYGAKLPIENSGLPGYVPLLRSALRGALNTVKKALVLDLDNTLWGGVIGDDGVDGIKLGTSDARSEAFSAFQAYVKSLAARGVILAVCSKNDPEIAKLGFAHIASILKYEDFAAFECSWGDKASGLRKIAKNLNIGLDSLVFVDDNPVECGLVQQELPMVATVHLDGDPADFVTKIEDGYWFQFQKYSREDFSRTGAYSARAAALVEQSSATDLPTYLKGLEMVGMVLRPEENQIERVVQLGQKTNQFNLLTRRYDEETIRAYLANEENIVFACSLKDKFGDHGLVSVLIGEAKGKELRIVEWVMSCRVFSRTFEQFIINEVIAASVARGITKIVGSYQATAKNAVVSELYAQLGFVLVDENLWELDLTQSPAAVETFVALASS
ncbi:HAD family hydrolase [Acetobacter sacchari]|uniref:HAD family hydrolase n=1 Tax=Acetobacter sacchari TaxID=2661687 RepID=A0ABS3LT84_9PROT|nr:HAD-IIIC family phosphatase [Acetobacter sacchari]MBO1359116.1 HAD family hydrolase [Acetobacter sacchari]